MISSQKNRGSPGELFLIEYQNWGLPLITYAPGGRGGVSFLYISIAYYMQKGGEGVQKACKNVCVINGRPHWKNGYLCIFTPISR